MISLPIRTHYENSRVHSEVLSVTTAYVYAYSSIRQLFQESLDDRPWLHLLVIAKEVGDRTTHTL